MTWRNTPVGRRGALVAALTIALLAAGCDAGAVERGRTVPVISPADALWVGPPEVRDVTEYTSGLDITVEEAQRRNGQVEAYLAGELSQWLDNRKIFHWVEETTDGWSVVVGRNKVNRKFAAKVEERVIGTPVEGLVEIRIVERDLSDFRRMETAIVESVGRWCLPPATSLEIDFAGNQLVMGVQSVGDFIEATDEAGISMPEGTVVVEEHRVEAAPSAATEPCEGPLNTLADARARWAAHGVDRYAYRASAWLYWLGSVDVEVRVWDGDVTEVITTELTPVDPRHTPLFGTRYGTVERLLDIVESHPVQWIGATYDANWGIPTSVSFNDPATSDEEWSFRIGDFRVLESAPGPAPPRDRDSKDDLLAIERGLPRDIVVVDAVIQPTAGVAHGDWGWRHTLDVTSVIYSSPGANPLELGMVEVVDRVGFQSPRALLHRDGDSTRLMLTHGRAGDWRVFAVMESTLDGLQLHGPLARRGYSEELAYLCHYPRDDIPTDPPPLRDAQTEFDLLLRWMDERGTFDPESDPDEVSKEALRRVCGQA